MLLRGGGVVNYYSVGSFIHMQGANLRGNHMRLPPKRFALTLRGGNPRIVSDRYYLARRILWLLVGSFRALRTSLGVRNGEFPIVMEFPSLCSDNYPMNFSGGF